MNSINSLVKFKFDLFRQAVNAYTHGQNEETIHDIRVGCRRMTEVLDVLRMMNTTVRISDIKEVFDKIRKNLSDIRDTEVMIAMLQDAKFKVNKEVPSEQSFLIEYLSEELRSKKILADETVRKIDITYLCGILVRLSESDYSPKKRKEDKTATGRSYSSAIKKRNSEKGKIRERKILECQTK